MTEQQIRKLYEETIGRSATTAEINFHIQKGTPLQSLIDFLYSSPEAKPERLAEIKRIYKQYIGREPNQEEIEFHLSKRTALNNLEDWAQKQKMEGQPEQPSQPSQPQPPIQPQPQPPQQNIQPAMGQPVTTPGNIDEYTLGQKLGLIYQQRPDLQEVFNSDGTAREGTPWATSGLTIENWAMMYGYKENPDLLSQYSPENMVKAAYINLFGPDRADDPGMQSWINAIKDGNIVSYNDLISKMKIDAGGEWANLTPAQQLANEYDYQDLITNDPDLSQYILGDTAKADIQKEVDAYYDKEKANYIKQHEISENRTIADWTKFTQRVNEDERRNMDESQLEFADAIYNATTNQAALGTIFSSLRQQKDQKLRDALARKNEITALNAKRNREDLTAAEQRALEDLEAEQEKYMLELEQRKKIETEQTIANKQSQLFQDFIIAGKLGENIPGTENIYGTAVGTPAGQFTIPEIPTGTTTPTTPTTPITCPTGQKLVNGVCVPISTGTVGSAGLTAGTMSEEEYQAYQKSKL